MDLKEKLLGLKLKEKEVDIKGLKVIVKELTAGQKSEYEGSLFKIVNGKPVYNTKNAKEKLIAYSCYDKDGNILFKIEDIAQIKQLPSSVSELLFDVATEINNADIEEEVKN